jgi:hypothetical protein
LSVIVLDLPLGLQWGATGQQATAREFVDADAGEILCGVVQQILLAPW